MIVFILGEMVPVLVIDKRGVSSVGLARQLGISQKKAWCMLDKPGTPWGNGIEVIDWTAGVTRRELLRPAQGRRKAAAIEPRAK
ncbi:MAG: hypothetical protein K6U03_01520 [Firmicutes bacterium]|nr:hypothetical protein [Bacillota bacterium]